MKRRILAGIIALFTIIGLIGFVPDGVIIANAEETSSEPANTETSVETQPEEIIVDNKDEFSINYKTIKNKTEKKYNDSFVFKIEKPTYISVSIFTNGSKCNFKIIDSNNKVIDSCTAKSGLWKKDGTGYAIKGSIEKKLKAGEYKLEINADKFKKYGKDDELAMYIYIGTLPDAGKIKTIKKGSGNKLLVEWKKSSSKGVKGYVIERATKKNGTYYLVKDVKGKKTKASIAMKDYAKNVKYYYRVRAYKENGEGEIVYSFSKGIDTKTFTWKE